MNSLRSIVTASPPIEWLTAVRAAGRDILIYFSPLHDEDHAPDCRNVIERIPVHRNDVGFHAGCEGSDLILHADGFGGPRSCRDDGLHRRLSAVPDPIDELLEISSKASRSDICSENNFDFAGERALEGVDPDRDPLLHVFESLRIEVSDA